MKTSTASQLPTYAVELFHIDEPAGSYDMLKVTCQGADCRGEFWVKPGAWRYRVGAKTASCPYCFKTAWVPDATSEQPEPEVQETARQRSSRLTGGPDKRKIVKRRRT